MAWVRLGHSPRRQWPIVNGVPGPSNPSAMSNDSLKTLPRQQRSRDMVAWIVEAGLQILAEGGPDALTIGRIAERAGVSVGSLYRYFEDKEAIIEAVYRRELDRELAGMDTLRAEMRDQPLREFLRAGFESSIERHRRLFQLHPPFYEKHAARLSLATYNPDESERVRLLIQKLLFDRRSEIRDDLDLDLTLFLIQDGMAALLRTAVQQRQDILFSEGLVDGVTDLVYRYLARDPSAR